MEAVESLAGLIFVGGILVGLIISTFTMRSYYAAALYRNVEAYRESIRKQMEWYLERIEELEKQLEEK